MKKRSKLKIIILSIISLIILGLGGYTLYFYCSTENYDSIIESLNERSLNDKSNFQSVDEAIVSTEGDYDFHKYIFFINNSREENQTQEMAIYKKKKFLFTNWIRYVDVHDTIGTAKYKSDDPVGALTTTLERDNGVESRVCIFYSDNNSDKQICKTDYTLYNGSNCLGTTTDETAGGDIYLFMVDHLGEEAIGQFISVPNVKFYNDENKLVYEYIH